MDELPEAAKRARLMELHIQASARPNCASVPYYPGEGLPYVGLISSYCLMCQAGCYELLDLRPAMQLCCGDGLVVSFELSSSALVCREPRPASVPGKGVERRVAQCKKMVAQMLLAGADTSAQYASQLPASAGGGAAGHALDQRNGDAGHAAAYEAGAKCDGHTGIYPYGWPGYWAQGYAMQPYTYAYPPGMSELAPADHGAAPCAAQGFQGGSEPMAPGTEAQHEAQRSSDGGAAAACDLVGSEPIQADADGLGLLAGYESGSEGSGEHDRGS